MGALLWSWRARAPKRQGRGSGIRTSYDMIIMSCKIVPQDNYEYCIYSSTRYKYPGIGVGSRIYRLLLLSQTISCEQLTPYFLIYSKRSVNIRHRGSLGACSRQLVGTVTRRVHRTQSRRLSTAHVATVRSLFARSLHWAICEELGLTFLVTWRCSLTRW